MQVVQDVVPANTRVPPDTHSAKNPNVNPGSPASAPPAVCFGTGSKGFLKIGESYFVNEDGKAPATPVDVGSNAFFGHLLPAGGWILDAVAGCARGAVARGGLHRASRSTALRWSWEAPRTGSSRSVTHTTEAAGYLAVSSAVTIWEPSIRASRAQVYMVP